MKLFVGLLIVVLVIIIGGAVFLGLWEPTMPQNNVEKIVPNERLLTN